MAEYEFWFCDDAGRRISLIKNFAFASYSRTTRGFGTLMFGLPFDSYLSQVPTFFQPDMRIDVWRSPAFGVPKRREGSFWLRKYIVYSRAEDGMKMIDFYGRPPIEILRRWAISTTDAAQYTITDHIDDMMKKIVRDAFIVGGNVIPSADEFSVDGDVALGPSITQSFQGKNILDTINNLKAISFAKNEEDPTNRRIFFDVVEDPGLTNGFGYIFRTYADLRGIDRTNGLTFSVENGNLKDPQYYEDYLDQITRALCNATEVLSNDRYLSRWNNIRRYATSTSDDVSENTSTANQMLAEGAKKKSLTAQFLSTPGSSVQPRCLYGVDWDLGDLLPVQFANLNFNAEVEIVWVSVDDSGAENIVGSNKVGLE